MSPNTETEIALDLSFLISEARSVKADKILTSMCAENRMAIRRKYLPDSTPAPQIEAENPTTQKQTPPTSGSATPATAQASASASASGSGSGSGSGTTTPAKPAQITAIEKEGAAALTPGLAASPTVGAVSGSSSTTSTPSKVSLLSKLAVFQVDRSVS